MITFYLAKKCRACIPVILVLIGLHAKSQNLNASLELNRYLTQQLKLSPNLASSVVISKSYYDESAGINHIYAHQEINGITVIGGNFALHTANLKKIDVNQLMDLSKWSVSSNTASFALTNAISKCMDDISYTESKQVTLKTAPAGRDQKTVYSRNESSIWDIPARLVYNVDKNAKKLVLSWEIQMMDVYKKHYWVFYVNAATGAIIQKQDIMMHCDFGMPNIVTDFKIALPGSDKANTTTEAYLKDEFPESISNAAVGAKNKYRVFALPFEHPNDLNASHNLTPNRGDEVASPDGWHQVLGTALTTYPYTHGNNVWAFQDPSPGPLGGVPSADPTRTAYNNTLPLGLPSLTEPFVFDYAFNANKEPANSMKAAIVNLFYWNNLMHDVYYRMGFTEAAGNFQESNTFSTGTRGSVIDNLPLDEVLAQAQDGGGTNNANFLTLPDGVSGQMQMYLWTPASADSLLQITQSSNIDSLKPGTKYYGVQGSFSTLPTANNDLYTDPVLNKTLVLIEANAASTVGTSSEGCATAQQSIALPPSNDVNGKIALIDRGTCSFVEKVLGAQLGGAVGAVVINNIDGPPLGMGGSDAPTNLIMIPAIMITKADGDRLKELLAEGVDIKGSLKRITKPLPGRDGDFDNGVISHEYGHGISSRLTGGGTGDALLPLGGDEQGGEGWSDFCALYMTLRNNDLTAADGSHPNGILPSRAIGNYVTYQANDGPGIRPAPYSISFNVNPFTFQNIDDGGEITVPHGVGSIWCEMLYEVLQSFIDQYGMNDNVYEGADPAVVGGHKVPNANAKGNNIAMRLIIEAMKLQPLNPTFQQERDAILSADTLLYEGVHGCMIWKAFAKRGLGASATSGSYDLGDEQEAFDVPLSCDPTQKRISVTKSGPLTIANGDTITYTIKVTNEYHTKAGNVVVRDTLQPGLKFISATNNPVVNGKMLRWDVQLQDGETQTFVVKAQVKSSSASVALFADDQETASTNWKTSAATNNGKWKLKSDASQAYSGAKYWFAPNVGSGGSNSMLQTTKKYAVEDGALLVFTHKFATENRHDGGVVEISEDGTTWNYLYGAQFLSGGYNNVIPVTNNPFIGTSDLAAFTGVQSTYITSVASLQRYAGSEIYIRFRMTSDILGGTEPNGGWWIDNVYILKNKVDIGNTAYVQTRKGDRYTPHVGSNAFASTSALLLAKGTVTKPVVESAVAEAAKVNTMQATIYPNPAKDQVNIQVTNPDLNNISILIYDNLGKQVAKLNGGNAAAINLPVNVQQMLPGTYWVEIKGGAGTKTYPLVIKR